MINEKFYDEIKEHLIANISDTFTLNLAISLWKDSKKYKVDSEYYKQALNEIKDYVNERLREDMPNKMLLEENKVAYGTIKEIIDKVVGNEE